MHTKNGHKTVISKKNLQKKTSEKATELHTLVFAPVERGTGGTGKGKREKGKKKE